MALYKLTDDTDYLLESIDFVLENTLENTDDKLLDSQYQLKNVYERNLLDAEKSIKRYEAELKNSINSKPRSWLERKLVGFKTKLRKFEIKYKLTKSNQSKGIIKRILSILTRIIKFITDKLLKFTRYVTDKFDKYNGNNKELKEFDRETRTSNIRVARGMIKMRKDEVARYKKGIADNDKAIELRKKELGLIDA